MVADPALSSLKTFPAKKKKPKKKLQKAETKAEPAENSAMNKADVDAPAGGKGLIVLGIFVIGVIFIGAIIRSTFVATDKNNNNSSDEGDFLTDYINRLSLTRRDYYRKVYLKSEAWKRKRYVVLKRDNWRWVYCDGPASEVHHTRYAKVNIGKELLNG